jgi:hypothetical protein
MARRDDDDRLGTARDEAERLIAAALAAASFASRQAARRSRERERGRRDDSLGDDLAGLAGAATRLVGGWLGGSDRDRRGNDRYADRYDGYGRRNDAWDADRPRAGNGDRRTASTHHIANGSDACCSCPVCRAIDFVREPSPEFVERVATGASDLASGVTSMLRAFSDVTGVGRGPRQRPGRADVIDDYPPRYPTEPTMAEPEPIGEPGLDAATDVPGASEPAHTPPPTPAQSRRFGGGLGADFSSVWQAATRAPMTDPPRRAPHTPKPMAKKAVKAPIDMQSESPAPPRPTGPPTSANPPRSAAAKRAPSKSTPTKAGSAKATSAKASTAKATPAKAAATKTSASTTKATPRKTAAKAATGTKATGTKATGTKATGTKAAGAKAAGAKAPGAKAASSKAAGAKAAGTKATGTKAASSKAAGTKATGSKATPGSAATRKAASAPRATRQPRG